MMKLNRMLLAGGMAAMLSLGTAQIFAQNAPAAGGQTGGNNGGGRGNRGNFDPAQFQQRMMDRYQEALEVKDDADWNIIQPLIQKVMDARMAVGFGGGRGMFGRGGPGGNNNNQGNRPGMAPNPEADTLQKAIEGKASNAELKGAMEKFVASRKDKQAALETAQANLRKVLSVRQEAILLSMGTL